MSSNSKLGDPRTQFGNHCNDQSNSVSETAFLPRCKDYPDTIFKISG